MTRSLIIAAILGLAACAPETPPQPPITAAPTVRPAPTAAFNPLDTGVAATPGSGGGGY
jgi:hypothetical protein